MNSLLFKLHRSYSIPLNLSGRNFLGLNPNIMLQLNPTAPRSPRPPGHCGAFAYLVSPWRGALANFAFGRAFAFPTPTPLVTQ